MRKPFALRKVAQRGFTLIELIVVIVVVGILAAVAIPKYQDMTNDANKSVADAFAGSFASAAATNYAICQAGSSKCVNLTTVKCDTATLTALVENVPSTITVSATATKATNAACVLENNKVESAPVLIKNS